MAKKKASKKTPKVTRVESVGVATLKRKTSSKAVEAAMSQAVVDALAKGISINDSETLRFMMSEAREKALTGN